MKREPILFFLLGISILLTGFSLFRSQSRIEAIELDLRKLELRHTFPAEEAILMNAMQHFQRFSSKLWHAGRAENWELAEFYAHELEEAMEELEEADIQEDGLALSTLIKSLPQPALENITHSIKARDRKSFKDHYQSLLQACNSCHYSTGKEFIKIQIPPSLEEENQSFSVVLP
ncbi:MAG: hypothetical protein AAF696_03420 [Bacteroidota bacterium]